MVARPLDIALVAMVGSRAVSLDRDAGETDHETALPPLHVFSSVHMSKEAHKPSQPPRLDPEMLQPVCTSTPLSRDPFVKRRGRLNPRERPSAHERTVQAPRIERCIKWLRSFKQRGNLRRASDGFKSARAFEKHSYLVVHAAARPLRVRATHRTTTDHSLEERRARGGPPPFVAREASRRPESYFRGVCGIAWTCYNCTCFGIDI